MYVVKIISSMVYYAGTSFLASAGHENYEYVYANIVEDVGYR